MGVVLTGFYCAVLFAIGEIAPVPLTANEHPWGRFAPNSWSIVQTTILSPQEGTTIQSLQTVRTTLRSIEGNALTLEVSETLELGGKTVKKKPQIVKTDFYQEPILENTTIRHGPPTKLLIDKKVVPCVVRIYEQQSASGKLTTTVWYTPHIYPYILRVEKRLLTSPTGDNGAAQIVRQSTAAVQTTSALKSLRSSRRNRIYTMQTVEKEGNITKITDARYSWDVPGGLLESTTREFDSQNREIRRSVSRMANYFLDVPVTISFPSRYYRSWLPVEATPSEAD